MAGNGNWAVWIHGLVAAFISGGAGGITSAFAAMGIDSEHFNLQAGLKHTLMLAGAIALVQGILGAALYLRQSPVPADWDGADRRKPQP